ncbi:MAG: hypothetical protein KJ759_11445 [Alphaproteobacteria bacterium]|nr:hypothetical protein [Alphaproteobacteria bacterium]MBV1782902.1 hypothetical protein [Hoeflea sp.]
MSVMYRIICRKLLVLIRLAIIASLAGYSLSNAAAAMHSAPSADNQASLSQTMDQPAIHTALHHDHDDESTGNDGSRLAKQDCCSDVCASFMLVTFQDSSINPAALPLREFVDEDFIFGEFPGLHRPPRI